MILVTVGTNEARFDRLLRAVANLDLGEDVLVQHGHSSPIGGPDARLIGFLPYGELLEAMRAARSVVTHAGVGSVMSALGCGKRPVVVPRLAVFGEAVDDHQLQLGRRFHAAGLVTLVEELEQLPAALAEDTRASPVVPRSSALAADLRAYLGEVATPAASPVRP